MSDLEKIIDSDIKLNININVDSKLPVGQSTMMRLRNPSQWAWMRLCILISLFLTLSTSQKLSAQNGEAGTEISVSAAELVWQTEQVAEGIIWKKYQGDELFDARLSINLIEIDLERSEYMLKLAYSDTGLTHTSEFAKLNNAIAAINGSFFDMERGLPVVYIKAEGETIARGAPGRNVYTENGGIGWNRDGLPVIVPRPDNGWVNAKYHNILASGPLLIMDHQIRQFNNDPFHQNRHPRTGVAITEDQKMLLMTVDGRSFQSYGLTIHELARLFSELGATDALNLDGGGSTVMWIDEQMDVGGVVSYPSGNFEFDH